MTELSSMLAEFHDAFDVADRSTPGIPSAEVRQLRMRLLREEFNEYIHAVAVDDVVEIADALADIAYVVFGTARAYGIPLDDVLAEVHRTNMAKLHDGQVVRRDDGKVLKPEGWTPPDIAGVLARYAPHEDHVHVAADSTAAGVRPQVSGLCRRERTLNDVNDYHPLQAITGAPLGWYSGDDGELCPECMASTMRGA